jgi:RNA polymerase sigma-70 factor (ECF subfamily)
LTAANDSHIVLNGARARCNAGKKQVPMQVNSNEEDKSFKSLYDKYYDPLYNYIFHQILNRENAEDVITTVFLNAFDFIQRKNPRINNFHAWIYKIATNEIMKFKNNRKNKPHLSIDDYADQIGDFTGDPAGKMIEDYSDWLTIKIEMESMSDMDRALITLHFFEEKTYSEISAILNIGENTLRPKMSRLLKKLHARLKEKI